MTDATAMPDQAMGGRGPFLPRQGQLTDSSVSKVVAAALAGTGYPLDGQYVVGIHDAPSVVARGLKEAIIEESHTEQRMLLVIKGPSRAQSADHKADLSLLAEHWLHQFNNYCAVHNPTLRAGSEGLVSA
jgi:hypothetical protein